MKTNVDLEQSFQSILQTQSLLADELAKTNVKLDKLAELITQQEVIKKELDFLQVRLKQLEQIRWWGATIIVGGALVALLKLIFKQ